MNITPSVSLRFMVLAFCGGVVLFTGQGYHFRIPYHPGPLGSLRVGKANDVPSSKAWERYSEWAKSYGDTIRLLLSNQHFVILKSKNILLKYLKKGLTNYPDRLYKLTG